MRKITVVIFAILFLCSTKLSSQNKPKEFYIGASVGISYLSKLIDNRLNFNGNSDFNISPVLSLNFEYRINKTWYLGLAYSHQNAVIRIPNFIYTHNGVTNEVFLNGNIYRNNVAVRALANFYSLDKFNFFSGLRLGYTFWSHKVNIPKDNISSLNLPSTIIAPQLILIGIRGSFTENIAANFELSFGSPYFTTFGIIYKL